MKRLIVTGAYPSGAGYPNIQNTLARLTASGFVEVIGMGVDMGQDLRLWREVRRGLWAKISLAASIGWQTLVSLIKSWRQWRTFPDAVLYLPHPPLPSLLLLSMVPGRWRPPTIADAYICVWDAVVRDRRLFREEGLPARLLKRLEARALSVCNRVIVDTQANAQMLADDLGVGFDKIVNMPLAINEQVFARKSYDGNAVGRCRVLFVGTFVPLHGLSEIVVALRELEGDDSLEFVFIGDGQEAGVLSDYLARKPDVRVQWERRWFSEYEIAEAIASADICLGVFGGPGKAARVLPFKLYSYFSVGRAVISQRVYSAPACVDDVPIYPVDSNGRALSAAIRELSTNPSLRAQLAERSAEYYEKCLGMTAFLQSWRHILELEAN